MLSMEFSLDVDQLHHLLTLISEDDMLAGTIKLAC
jgi:hypothetical protein